MSSKGNAVCKTVGTRANKNTLEKKQQQPTSDTPSEGLILYDNCKTLIQVCVNTKGLKRTSTMVSSSPPSHKGIEEKKRPGSSGDSHQSWGGILRDHNRATLKQGLQQLTKKTPASKSSKTRSDSKESRKQSLTHPKQEHKHLDEIPVKQSASQKRIEDHTKSTPRTTNPSSTSIPSSMNSVIICDKAVQCGGIPDDKARKILSDMEQILFRIPTEFGKPTSMGLEEMALRAKLEATTLQLEETSRKMNTLCESSREERDSLQRQLHKHVLLLNESRERQLDLESTVKTLRQELEEAIKTNQARDKTITELRKEIKGHEFSQKIIADLRINLAEQTELARQRHLEVQYLTLEKDKLSVLSSYKDTLLIELRNAIKEVQNHIADQLSGLKDVYVREENPNPQLSLVYGGIACSSPTSTSSRDFNISTSWHEISDVSLPTMGRNPSKDRAENKFLNKSEELLTTSETKINSSEKKRTKNSKELQTKDSGNLEFISLPGGESSLTLLPSYKDLIYNEISQSMNKGKEDATTIAGNEKNTNNKISLDHLSTATDKTNGKDPLKSQQSLELLKKQSDERKFNFTEDVSSTSKNNLPNNLIGSSITEQFQNMFHDIRVQSRVPVNVPSPPRNYPHPDWSDSTLPSISTASELNVVQSNDALTFY